MIERIRSLLKYETAGDPISGLKWTRKTPEKIAHELGSLDIDVSPNTVAKLLKNMGFRPRVNHKKVATTTCVDRDEQFLHFLGGPHDLVGPVGLAIREADRSIFVVDTQLHQVKVFGLDGEYRRTFGSRGDERGQFYHPLGIAIGRDDTVYVVDSFHFAVQAFTPQGEFLFSFGPRASGASTLARPRSIAVDPKGRLLVTDALRHHVQLFSNRRTAPA